MTAARLSLALVAVLGSGNAMSARLPDWARAIADAAPALPEGISEHGARVLFDETRVTVEPDGKLVVRRRTATQALRSDDADGIAIGAFPIDDRTSGVRSRAWHVPPEGKTRKTRGSESVDVALPDVFLTDRKLRFIQVDDVKRGSLVFFEFDAVERPYDLSWRERFFDGVAVDRARFVLELPPDWKVRWAWLRRPGPDPTIDGTTRTWEIRGLEPARGERLGPDPAERAPLLLVAFEPPPGESIEGLPRPEWEDLGVWWDRVGGSASARTPEVDAAAQALAGDNAVEITLAAGRFVRDRVRYVAKEIGIEGYRPHPANQVLSRLYGDCKDKSTLLRALLAARGIRSYPILVNAIESETVAETVPSLYSFNHMIVAVAIDDDARLPEPLAAGEIRVPGLGRLWLVDTTEEYAAVGSLPESLEGKTGLLLAGAASTLVRLPGSRPGAHRLRETLEATLGPDGTIAGTLRERRYGGPASTARLEYRDNADEWKKAIEEELRRAWPGVSVASHDVEDETEDGGFVETLALEFPHQGAGTDRVELFPAAISELPRVSLGRREGPVEYPHALSLHFESTLTGLPEEVATPEGLSAEGDGWSVASRFDRDGPGLRASWDLVLRKTRFEPDAFGDLKTLWSAARRTAAAAVSRRR